MVINMSRDRFTIEKGGLRLAIELTLAIKLAKKVSESVSQMVCSRWGLIFND